MSTDGRAMKARPHRPVGIALEVIGSKRDGVLAEDRAAGRLLRGAPLLGARIEDGAERLEPAVGLLVAIVADDGEHEQLARTRGRDVEEPVRLLAILPEDLVATIEELLR